MRPFTVTAFVLAAFVAVTGVLEAHGTGQLKLASTSVIAGTTLRFTGAKFPKNESFDVLLAGPSGRKQLASVTADAKGAFQDSVVIPGDVAPGAYRIVLIASDDDEAAQADLQVAAAEGGAMDHHEHMAGMDHDMSAMMGDATAEPLQLARARSPWVTGGAFLAIGLALAIGAMAVLRPHGDA